MRIVHLSDYYQPKVGYQEPNLAKAHAKMGHEVHVITSDRYYPFFNYQETFYPILGERMLKPGTVEKNGITIHRLPVWYEHAGVGFAILKGIEKKLKEIKPDMVFSHDILTTSAYSTAKAKSKLNYRLVYDNHAAPFNTNLKNSFLKRMYTRLWKSVIRPKIVQQADKIAAVGPAEQELAAQLLEIPLQEIEIITLGADTDVFKPDEKKRNLMREELGIKEGEVLIVHGGKMTRNKNVDILLEVFHRLLKEFANIRLLLIGNGSEEYVKGLKLFIAENELINRVIWINTVPNDKLVYYFNAADIGVWAGNPSNIIQEAIASGLPVIIYPHPTTEFLVKNENGIILDLENLKRTLLDNLRLLISDSKLRQKMGKSGREHAEKTFSWEAIGEEFLKN